MNSYRTLKVQVYRCIDSFNFQKFCGKERVLYCLKLTTFILNIESKPDKQELINIKNEDDTAKNSLILQLKTLQI